MSKPAVALSNILYLKTRRARLKSHETRSVVVTAETGVVFTLRPTRQKGAVKLVLGNNDPTVLSLPAHERRELEAMRYLSDDALWTIAREVIQPEVQDRLSALMERHSVSQLPAAEQAELAALVERGDRLMLRKAAAMQYLTERGHQVTAERLKPLDN